jgi:hypothetical protein
VLAAISASANYRDRFLRRSFDEMTEEYSDEAIAGIFDAFESLPGIGPTTASQVARFLLPQNAAAFNSETRDPSEYRMIATPSLPGVEHVQSLQRMSTPRVLSAPTSGCQNTKLRARDQNACNGGVRYRFGHMG